MRCKNYIMELLGEIIYSGITVIYLIRLSVLNKELISKNFSTAWELLMYRQFTPVKFFIVATVLFFIGCYLLYKRLRYLRRYAELFEELIASILTIVVLIILLVSIIILINNPILKAVFTLGIAVSGCIGISK